jgi:hypothetical protein
MSVLLATQEMQGMHVYVLGVIAVGAGGGLIYALVRRIGRNRAGGTPPDHEPGTVPGPEATRSDRGPGV